MKVCQIRWYHLKLSLGAILNIEVCSVPKTNVFDGQNLVSSAFRFELGRRWSCFYLNFLQQLSLIFEVAFMIVKNISG